VSRKRLDNWYLKGPGERVVAGEGFKLNAGSKPTRVMPKMAKLKVLDKSLHTSNDYGKMNPVVDPSEPIPVVLQHMRKKR
jgi:hypothetical protein